MNIPIIFEDSDILAINKPQGIHVHPTRLSRNEENLQELLQEQINLPLYPVHRLDRPVSGVLLFAKNSQSARKLCTEIRNRTNFRKHYLCIVRGWLEDSGVIKKELRQSPGKPEREALTRWRRLAQAEAPWKDERFPRSRYTLLECMPETGRTHQIRRHLAFSGHPILGDTGHGDNQRNKIWKENTSIKGLLLHAYTLSFLHPISEEIKTLRAGLNDSFLEAMKILGWTSLIQKQDLI